MVLIFGYVYYFGAIIALTEPLAAIESIRKKGASKSLIAVIEGESLFNDGISVTLIVLAKGMLASAFGQNIFFVVFREILGAIAVGLIISFIMFKILKSTNNPIMHILVSLMDVALIYAICNSFDFSGVIASVVAGMYFSTETKKIARWKEVVDSKDLYNDFWNVASFILSSILYVLVGTTILSIELSMMTLILIPIAIIINLIARYIGVFVASNIVGKKNVPSKYSMNDFVKILTVAGLKGGVSLAIAMTLKDILPFNEYNILLTTVFITVLFTTIVQGLIAGKVYSKIEEKNERKYAEKALRKI